MASNQNINGTATDNTLTGGNGNDTINGLAGNDVFKFTVLETSDFGIGDSATGDKIDLSAIDANTDLSGDQAFAWVDFEFSNKSGELLLYGSGMNSYLNGDVDGDGIADLSIRIGFMGGGSISNLHSVEPHRPI